MESAMVPSFFIFTPIPHYTQYSAQQMAWYPRQIKHTPPIGSPSLFGLNIYKVFPYEGGTFSNASKMFFRKMENFFSIRKCISSKKRKIHLGQCKAKLFFTVIFQICGC